MISFNDKEPSINELMLWKRNQNINPRTKRKIKKGKVLFNYLKKKYKDKFKNGYDYLDSIDNRDPITLNYFWKEIKNGKEFVYKNLEDLILYKDDNNNIRCIEKKSLEYLKYYNINRHPVTMNSIPDFIMNNINNIDLKNNENIESKSLRVFNNFQIFQYL